MLCPHCGKDYSETSSFCGWCGAAVGPKCAVCGHANRIESRFCANCGKPLSAFAILSKTSGDVLRSLSASGGERKRVTVLFADISNSTELIATVDPEQAMQRFQPIIEVIKNAVHRYDGIVNNIQGDGAMAIFGAPVPHEDHGVRGCLAALAMQDAVARLRDPDLSIRVGVHTGEVVVKATENTLYQTYDATGVAVHLASRVEKLADKGGILLTADTFNEAKQFLEATPLGERSLRGLAAPVYVFQLTGLKHAPASERFRSGPRVTPFFGRRSEMSVLEAELANTINGAAGAVGVVGEAGLGKSRLCFEFAEACRRKGIRVLEARVLAHGRETPLQPVLELLRDVFGIRPNDSPDISRRRVIEFINSRGGLSDVLPLVLDFLGLPDPTYPAPKLDSTARKDLLLNFVRQLLHSRPRDEVVLVLIEDLHWIDPASEEFVAAIVDAIVGTKTLLVLNFRPGLMAAWMQRSHYRQITLVPLQSAATAEILRNLLGDDPSIALLARNIAERGQGNPFFLEELVYSLVERGDFEGQRGGYRLKAGFDAVPLPTNVQAVLSARVDRLAEPLRQLLQTASVIGREVPVAILEKVTGLPPRDLAQELAQLRQTELLYELPPFERGIHAFSHPLIQEVAYKSLLHERRRELHGAVARAMQLHFKSRLDEYAGLLAHHLEQSGDALQAAQANMRAAIWMGANDASQALRYWKKVRELLLPLKPDRTIEYMRMMACGQIVNFGWREGIAPEDAKLYFEEAKNLALASGDMRANALIHASYGRLIGAAASADDYVDKIREAEAVLGETVDASLRVTLRAVLCHALRLSGRMSDALAANTAALDHVSEIQQFDRQMLGFDIEPWLIALRGHTLVMLGRGDEARPDLDRVIAMDSAKIDVTHHVIPSVAYVDLAWTIGDIQLAERHAERAFLIAIKSGSPYLRVYTQACRGLSHIVAGRSAEAIRDLVDGLGFARRRKAGLEGEARILADLANAYRINGDFAAAVSAAEEAITISTARHNRVAECLGRIVLAKTLHALNGGAESAEVKEEMSRAGQLIEETGAVIFAPFAQFNMQTPTAGFYTSGLSRTLQ
jgi:class 3 adenylate cyclase/tetratricopeptide (TPR) repeat protein